MSVIKKETLKIEPLMPREDTRFYDKERLDRNIFLKIKKFFLESKVALHRFGTRRFSIMITPHTGARGYTMHISNYLLFFGFMTVALSTVSVTYILTKGHQVTRNQVRLVEENDKLENKIFQVSETVDSLSEYFAKFRLEVGSVISSATSESSMNDPLIAMNTDTAIPQEIIKLQKLEKELDITKEKIFHIGNFMQENQRVLREIPSLYPLASRGRITSRFGLRRNPFDHRGWESHDGIDLAVLPGTPVYASADGVVSRATVMGGYGNVIELKHKYGFASRYAHLQSFASQMYPGARVKQGQVIGYVGATGRVTGYHLHYEVWIGGSRVDPEPFAMMLR